jgi:hypothetical protein
MSNQIPSELKEAIENIRKDFLNNFESMLNVCYNSILQFKLI